jgi:hypothetical protein
MHLQYALLATLIFMAPPISAQLSVPKPETGYADASQKIIDQAVDIALRRSMH